MNSKRNQFIQQTARTALITSVALALLLPGGLAAADSGYTSVRVPLSTAAAGQAANSAAPDPAKAKITQEQAIAKLRELFPVLKEATVSNVRLGTDSYPPSGNQMVWNVQWQYQLGSSGYGFSSLVDAMTGDLVNTYISYPMLRENAFYPPEFSREEALAKARSFIAAAAPSLAAKDLVLDDNDQTYMGRDALFGMFEYRFPFRILRNGLPSAADMLNISVDGNGNIVQFSKPATDGVYPSAKPAVSPESASKQFAENFKVGLYYIPIYKDGAAVRWILGWRPESESLSLVDAQTGKSIDNEGEAITAAVTYEAIPERKNTFQPASAAGLTAAAAAKLVQQVAAIPAERKLSGQNSGVNSQNDKQKLWRLSWEASRTAANMAMPERTYAEVDSSTGEIIQFQLEQYGGQALKEQPAPAGGTKLTQAQAKERAIELINRLYPKASGSLKLAEHGGKWSILEDGKGYRYQFLRYYQGIPVSDSNIVMTMDVYGRLQSYMNTGNTGYEALKDKPVPAVSGAEALQSYLGRYDLKLQYSSIGGYNIDNKYVEPVVKLVYAPTPADSQDTYKVLDAQTKEWVTTYESPLQSRSGAEAVDLKGHAAEQALTELLNYGVLSVDADKKVNPDQEITAGDWFTLIARSSTPYYAGYSNGSEPKAVAGVSPDSPYYEAVSYAAEREWISRGAALQPESKLSREQLAVLLASFLKYDKLSAFLGNDSVITGFSDNAAIQDKGAVALAVKLGLLQGENGKFNPQQIVTKAQAANVIMKLVELQGRTDQVIGQ
ncbi:S-layer homology domain-containing protein [Paenibacillus sp. FSL H8-0259]|uniref:S-layer homology domain-containing protein n=1 Tax=Paenibacillus sp. FSL H8-0259 TaxID=1920423 RepID=UPI00096EC828|nr:S-layer homology domain-containing protein [Paenibacillus sp. FSL H8-0259]OMF21602.1 hypothetical protein BK132_32315 [Paenibacillus sp. FSL H8-0259]